MTKTSNKDFTIEQLLPHRAPMILLDSLESFCENTATCSHLITEQSLLFDSNLQGVPSYVGIEYMAQSIAAYANANELVNNRSVQIGFLVSSRKFKCDYSVFPLGMALTINVKKLYKDESGLSAFDCEIYNNDTEIASARINVFQPENPSQFLAEQL
ncbi:hotdog family protein [Colwellia sp. E2M01]|nr:hotdog family protein [Colwellia sp. E2M01]